jgi:hypothetical protein
MNLGQEIDAINQWASEKGSTIKIDGTSAILSLTG